MLNTGYYWTSVLVTDFPWKTGEWIVIFLVKNDCVTLAKLLCIEIVNQIFRWALRPKHCNRHYLKIYLFVLLHSSILCMDQPTQMEPAVWTRLISKGPPVVNHFYHIEKDGWPICVFKLTFWNCYLPEVVLKILNRKLSEAGIPEIFSLP